MDVLSPKTSPAGVAMDRIISSYFYFDTPKRPTTRIYLLLSYLSANPLLHLLADLFL